MYAMIHESGTIVQSGVKTTFAELRSIVSSFAQQSPEPGETACPENHFKKACWS